MPALFAFHVDRAKARAANWNAAHRVGTEVEYRFVLHATYRRARTTCEAYVRHGIACIHVEGHPSQDVPLQHVRTIKRKVAK